MLRLFILLHHHLRARRHARAIPAHKVNRLRAKIDDPAQEQRNRQPNEYARQSDTDLLPERIAGAGWEVRNSRWCFWCIGLYRFILQGQGFRLWQFAARLPHQQAIAAARHGDERDGFLQVQLSKRAAQFGDHHPYAVVRDFYPGATPADLHQLFLGKHLTLRLGQCGETQARALGEGNGLLRIRPGKFSGLYIQR